MQRWHCSTASIEKADNCSVICKENSSVFSFFFSYFHFCCQIFFVVICLLSLKYGQMKVTLVIFCLENLQILKRSKTPVILLSALMFVLLQTSSKPTDRKKIQAFYLGPSCVDQLAGCLVTAQPWVASPVCPIGLATCLYFRCPPTLFDVILVLFIW